MKILLQKIFTMLIWMRHPRMISPYRWFLRNYYISNLFQYRYFIKDYIIKKKYKVVDFYGEFQQELLYVIPYAYWHYKNKTLKKTISSKGTNELYFFSQNHEEVYERRDWKCNFDTRIPNGSHNHKLNKQKWLKVPYKEVFKNDIFLYDKPILVVANRFNSEWGESPISYFDISVLDEIFNQLKNKYTIIYNRPPEALITNDNSEVYELGDYNWIRQNHPYIIQLSDLYEEHKHLVSSYNHLQLLLYANCENFISVHGGTATLASNFGGTNIIYSKKGHEHYLKEFEIIFPELSGAKIYLAKDYKTLKLIIKDVYI